MNLPTRQWSRGRHERDHIGGRVSCIDIITPDLTENAEYVNEAWRTASQSRLAGIFQTGRRLIEIRDRYIDPATQPSSVIQAPRTEHSAKPPEFYEAIEQMYPQFQGQWYELFLRGEARKNWAGGWGNEVT